MAMSDDSSNDKDDSSNDEDSVEEIDLDSVSDEEALLACRAYLQRKNRLGLWTEAQRRKRLQEQVSPDSVSSSSVGYFWENPEELVYWKGNPQPNDTVKEEKSKVQKDGEEEEESPFITRENLRFELVQETNDNDSEDSLMGYDFTGFPLVQPDESKRRSEGTSKKWQDPQWKAMWYEKRWGGRQSRISKELEEQKKIDARIQSLPPQVLSSPELVNMSSDEIAEAIRIYVVANQKRSKSHKKRHEQKRQKRNQEVMSTIKESPEKKTPRDALFSMSEEAMRERQRKRSERSVKYYQTRLKNERKRSSTKPERKVPKRVPKAKTPRDAIVRIQADLDSDRLPSVEDVKLVIPPLKLGRRKELLRRLLSEHFDLRGKVVPEDLSKNDSKLLFVTTAPIDKLGAFVIHNMQEKETE